MTVSHSQPSSEYDEDLSKRMQEARYFLNFRQDGPDCDHADLIDEAIDEIAALKARTTELEEILRGVIESDALTTFEGCECESCAPIMRARSALSHAGPVARDGEQK